MVTRNFELLARGQAKYKGAASLPILVIPHPLEGLPRETIERVVSEQVEFLEACLLRRAAAGPTQAGAG